MVRKYLITFASLVALLGLAFAAGTGGFVHAKDMFGYGEPPPSRHSKQSCNDDEISVYTKQVGADVHVFRGWFANGSHELLSELDLTPNLTGAASYPAVTQCIVAYELGGNLYTVGPLGGMPFQVTKDSSTNHPDWDNGQLIYDMDGNIYVTNPDGTGTHLRFAGNNPVVMPDGTIAFANQGTVQFWQFGPAVDSKVVGTPTAWSYSGLMISNGEKLQLLSFPDGKLIDVAASDFVSDPSSQMQIAGHGVTDGGLVWLDPEQKLLTGDQPDWWKSDMHFDQAAFQAYLNSLK